MAIFMISKKLEQAILFLRRALKIISPLIFKEAILSHSSSLSSSSLASTSSSRDILGFKVEDTFEALAIRQKAIDDDVGSLEAPFKTTSCSMECWVSSTLLAQQLEETHAFLSWQQDIASISS